MGECRKSSYSGGGGGQCVEGASAELVVKIRDTTNRDGVTQSVSDRAWRGLLNEVRSGRLALEGHYQTR